ncbi:MAG: glycosyltransferase [Rhodospirillales bacterium]|nr:glycosyltransferase [Rhodospirillales bacterium]
MLHFFPTFSRDAEHSPLGDAVRRAGIAHRFFPGAVSMAYRSRWELVFLRLPALGWYAWRTAFASLVLSRPAPSAVLVGSDVHVLVFGVLRWLLRRRTRIVLTSFIYTSRPQRWRNALRRRMFRRVLSFADLVIVHSRLEVDTYPAMFGLPQARFCFIPWGTTIAGREEMRQRIAALPPRQGPPVVVSAGRSGRDYPTLFAAVEGMAVNLRVICDFRAAVRSAPLPENVAILESCYGQAYIAELAGADIVAVPLRVEDISAGQMVVVQAMALGKAIVVTRTPTMSDYVIDGQEALTVERGDAAAMRAALARLAGDDGLRARLGAAAMGRYERSLTTEAHMQELIAAVCALEEDRTS